MDLELGEELKGGQAAESNLKFQRLDLTLKFILLLIGQNPSVYL